MAWETGFMCLCCLLLQLTATHFVRLRLHHRSGWFLQRSSGITSSVVVVTPIGEKKHLSFLRAICHACQPLCH